jgi:5'(3')-deoxyribonucleotidase
MIIASDIDEVLADFLVMFLKYRNDTYGTDWRTEQFYTYVWSEVFGESKERMYSILSDFFVSDHIRRIRPKRGAVAGIKELAREHTIYVTTSRPRIIAPMTEQWLERHFPNCFTRVFFSNQPAYGSFGATKGEICHSIGADIFLDDQYSYCEECLKEGIEVILFDSPWNRELELPPHVTRVRTWGEATAAIKARDRKRR